jgi:hypothetical protein
LEVSVGDLAGSDTKPSRSRPGPTPQLALRLEQIQNLPRKEQLFVLKFLDTILEKAGRS